MKQPVVYILASKKNGTLYVGVTSDLVKRIWQHKNHTTKGFTAQHQVNCLVYFEQFDDMENAIVREKQLKIWGRAWKVKLIEKNNSNWSDLYEGLFS
ncbi:MAG: endonuclease [Gammaproteobacteria bacterium]|nr:MAG: endonuclease [Gammaproteobacteria bacterium]